MPNTAVNIKGEVKYFKDINGIYYPADANQNIISDAQPIQDPYTLQLLGVEQGVPERIASYISKNFGSNISPANVASQIEAGLSTHKPYTGEGSKPLETAPFYYGVQKPQPPTTQQPQQNQIPQNELPYQTYERITGKKWTGGASPEIQSLYKQYNITAPAGSAEANLALQKALVGGQQPPTPTPQKSAEQPRAIAEQPTTTDQTGTQSFGEIFKSAGIQGIDSPTTTKIEDVIKQVSTAFGMTDISNEVKKLDDQYADDTMKVNSNPWLSEGLRSKQISLLQNKYETKKNALVDRLKLQGDITGKAIDVYYKEKEYQKDLLFKQLDLASKKLDEKKAFELSPGQVRYEYNSKTGRYEQVASVAAKPEKGLDELLSVDEAIKFGIPYGTTKGEVVGKVPAAISQLGIEATKTRENAISGLAALKVVEEEINKDQNILLKAAVPGSIFARKFETARKEASDVITRLRTGAALNESEERFYKSQLPTILDYKNPEAIKYKIELFRNLFERLQKSSPIQSFQSQNNDPLGIR